MGAKKAASMVLALMLVSIFVFSVPGYALKICDNHKRGSTEPGAITENGETLKEVVDKTISDGGTGGRVTDIGHITARQHNAINTYLTVVGARSESYTVSEEEGENGEIIRMQSIPGLYNPAKGRVANGHYSIRGEMQNIDGKMVNVVYVYVDSDVFTQNYNGNIVSHEVMEYNLLVKAAQEKFNQDGALTVVEVKKALVKWLDNPKNAKEATALLQGAHDQVVAQLGPVSTSELVADVSESLTAGGVRGAAAPSSYARNIFFNVSQESFDAINSPAETVSPEVAKIFDQVFAVDGSKIEGKEDGFKQYLANKAVDEAVVAVFKNQGDLDRIAKSFMDKTGEELADVVHVRVLGIGDLAGIKEEQLMAMFNSGLASGDFYEVKLGAALQGYKTVIVAVGKRV